MRRFAPSRKIERKFARTTARYILAQSVDRVNKERAMRRRQLKWLWGRLKELVEQP